MAEFEATRLKLKDGHTWSSKPGYKIFVLDRGALRFDIPQDWVMEPGETSVRFYDRRPPDDNCRLEVSLLAHSQFDWKGLPLDQLLRDSVGGPGEQIRDVHHATRPGVEVAWTENLFMDPEENRPAHSRIAVVRGINAHALLTLDFWAADAERVVPVWDEVVRSLDMGLKVRDPVLGEQRM